MNNEGLTFSKLTFDEIEEVVNEEKKAFNGDTLDEDFYYADLSLNPFAEYYVLRRGDAFIGFFGVWVRDRSEIVNLFITPEYQHQGYSKIIMEKLDKLLTKRKVKEITLEVRVSNIKAQRLYESFGFLKKAIRRRYYHDGEDAYLMYKKKG